MEKLHLEVKSEVLDRFPRKKVPPLTKTVFSCNKVGYHEIQKKIFWKYLKILDQNHLYTKPGALKTIEMVLEQFFPRFRKIAFLAILPW